MEGAKDPLGFYPFHGDILMCRSCGSAPIRIADPEMVRQLAGAAVARRNAPTGGAPRESAERPRRTPPLVGSEEFGAGSDLASKCVFTKCNLAPVWGKVGGSFCTVCNRGLNYRFGGNLTMMARFIKKYGATFVCRAWLCL